MRNITVLAGGKGGAPLVSGLVRAISAGTLAGIDKDARLTIVGTTADDLWLHGLKVCPDLDALMHATRPDATPDSPGLPSGAAQVRSDLQAYGVEPQWFPLEDQHLATHLVRTQMVEAGYPLSDVTAALARRWNTDVTLIPMSNDRVETHVAVADPESPSGRRVVHLQEYRHHLRRSHPAEALVSVGLDRATPAPGLVEALRDADLVLLAPSNPVVALGSILALPGVRDALRSCTAPVVGLSPVGPHAPAPETTLARTLAASGIAPEAGAIALHLGGRAGGGILDAWLVAPEDRAACDAALATAGITVGSAPVIAEGSAPGDVVQVLTHALEIAREFGAGA